MNPDVSPPSWPRRRPSVRRRRREARICSSRAPRRSRAACGLRDTTANPRPARPSAGKRPATIARSLRDSWPQRPSGPHRGRLGAKLAGDHGAWPSPGHRPVGKV